ncbi:hypothetical protein QOK74_08180 [Staphylococcus saprophyticus]|uniref:hypothetical protein n=1 Tax=Staphylococcus saprophyticus TaxID=29385 RepID=UPI0024C3FC62|nr:hypothetical protein [Staphylococcus saprophyticus]MDK1672848.1 hypothetical protein [Staphylococcus saprophyticus]
MFDIKQEIKILSQKHFENQKYICILYGSSVEKVVKSDLDLCFILEHYDKKILNDLSDDIKKLHHKLNLTIDEEITFNNKLLFSQDEVKNLLQNNVYFTSGDKINIIQENSEFFESKEMKGRLLYNILTTKHRVLLNKVDYELLNTYKYESWKLVIKSIFKHNKCSEMSFQNLLEYLISDGKKVNDYKDFLGYSSSNIDVETLEYSLLKMEEENIIAILGTKINMIKV